MSSSVIKMGNDEFILFIRKNYPDCKTSNASLGQKIWDWLASNKANAKQERLKQPCFWGGEGKFIGAKKLPKFAAQFSFNRKILPDLYDYLGSLGREEC